MPTATDVPPVSPSTQIRSSADDSAPEVTITVGLSNAFHNKDGRQGMTQQELSDSFVPQTVTLAQFADHIERGKAIVPALFKGKRRLLEDFRSLEIMAFDLEAKDRDVSVEDALNDPFLRKYAFFIHPSASSGQSTKNNPQGFLRLRAYVRFSENLEGQQRAGLLLRAAREQVQLPIDSASAIPNQHFYGSTNRIEVPYRNFAAPPVSVQWLAGFLSEQAHSEMERALTPRQVYRPIGGARAVRYAEKAFNDELDKLARTPSGERNHQLYRSSRSLFGLALSSWSGLSEGEVEQALEAVVRGWEGGSLQRKTWQTIQNGRKAAQPRTPPEDRALVVPRPPVSAPAVSGGSPHQEIPRYHAGGVPDTWRTALLNVNGRAALSYELITEGARQQIPGFQSDRITVPELMRVNAALGWKQSEASVRRALEDLQAVFLSESDTDPSISVSDSDRKSLLGRPADVWALPPLDFQRRRLIELTEWQREERAYPARTTEFRPAVLADLQADDFELLGVPPEASTGVAAEFEEVSRPARDAQAELRRKAAKYKQYLDRGIEAELADTCSTPLPGGEWRPSNLRQFRCALLRAWYGEDPDNPRLRGNRKISLALGINMSSVGEFLRSAGIATEGDQYAHLQLDPTRDTEQQIDRFCKGKGMPIALVRSPDSVRAMPYSLQEAQWQLEEGQSVWVRVQLPNKHSVISEAQPVKVIKTSRGSLRKSPSQDVQSVDPAPPDRLPRVRRLGKHRGSWVRHQIALTLEAQGWKRNGRYLNPNTGEMAPLDADGLTLLELLLERPVVKPPDPLVAYAESLGAVILALT